MINRAGFHIGQGNVKWAKKISLFSLAIGNIFAIILITIAIVFKDSIIKMFTSEVVTTEYANRIWVFMCIQCYTDVWWII